LLYLAM